MRHDRESAAITFLHWRTPAAVGIAAIVVLRAQTTLHVCPRAHPPTPFLLGAHLQWINFWCTSSPHFILNFGDSALLAASYWQPLAGAWTGLIFSIVVITYFLLLLDYDYLWDADRLEFCYSSVVAVCVVFVRWIRRRFRLFLTLARV